MRHSLDAKPKKRASQTGTLIGVRMQPEMLQKLDDWRRGEQDLPSRPDAVRRLLELAFLYAGQGRV